MGSVHPDAVDGLVKIAYLELARIQEARHPTLFPAESYVDEVVAARKKKREDKALVIKDARKLHEIRRICLGFHEVIGMIRWGLQRCLIRDGATLQAVLLRLATPGESKLGHSRKMSKDAGVEVPVEKFYRMMDAVTEDRAMAFKQLISDQTLGLLGGKLTVLFFDVTTLSFASENSDELRKKGYSKDGKPQRVQVDLIQTKEGLPVTYELAIPPM